MFRFPFLLIFLACIFFQKNAFSQNTNEILEDKIYQKDLQTVILYPDGGNLKDMLLPPVVALNSQNLVLVFDQFGDRFENLAVKIINCKADWTVSQVNYQEYLYDFNEFYIRQREASFNTKTAFVNYRFPIPTVKIGGNYILKVYKNGDENEVWLTRRFMVYEEKITAQSNLGLITGVEEAFRNQQIDFFANYNNFDVPNPKEQIQVVLRQNYRWDNAITQLRPTFVKEFQKELHFQYFNLENQFKGGNEFRLFDIRSNIGRGFNIREIELLPKRNHAYAFADISRNGRVYDPTFDDQNGRFWIENRNSSAQDAHLDADYFDVTFQLKHQPLNGRVFISGAFSDWQISPNYEMQYVDEEGLYQITLPFKQGYYNYQYVFAKPDYSERDDLLLEGSHNRTRNAYEILIYYRPLGGRTDYLVGYRVVQANN